MKISIQTDSICNKRYELVSAIVGVAAGMGYCPGIFGWETDPNLTRSDCDTDNCFKCWNYAKAKAMDDQK